MHTLLRGNKQGSRAKRTRPHERKALQPSNQSRLGQVLTAALQVDSSARTLSGCLSVCPSASHRVQVQSRFPQGPKPTQDSAFTHHQNLESVLRGEQTSPKLRGESFELPLPLPVSACLCLKHKKNGLKKDSKNPSDSLAG